MAIDLPALDRRWRLAMHALMKGGAGMWPRHTATIGTAHHMLDRGRCCCCCCGCSSVPELRAGAGSRPGGRGTCSLLRQRKVPQRKATPLPVSPSPGGEGAACEARSERMDTETGHCFARPDLPRCASACRQRAARTDTWRSCEAAAVFDPAPTPSGCAEKHRAWGGCVYRRTHALRPLACRSCLNGVRPKGELSEFCGTTPGPSIAGCPRSPDRANGGRRLGVAFSLPSFFWRCKRKKVRRRAHIPAPALCKSTQAKKRTTKLNNDKPPNEASTAPPDA